jgi:anti-anti-sigma factor
MATSEVSTSSKGPNIAPLSIRNTVRAGRHTLTLTGELDLDSATDLEEAVREVCAAGAGLVIDLRKVTFMDSTGLRVLIVAATLCEEKGHELRIIPGEDIQRILEMTGLDRVLQFTSR